MNGLLIVPGLETTPGLKMRLGVAVVSVLLLVLHNADARSYNKPDRRSIQVWKSNSSIGPIFDPVSNIYI